jgi:hypothetical protein
VEVADRDERASLLQNGNNYDRKKFLLCRPLTGPIFSKHRAEKNYAAGNAIKLFSLSRPFWQSKLGCLSLLAFLAEPNLFEHVNESLPSAAL